MCAGLADLVQCGGPQRLRPGRVAEGSRIGDIVASAPSGTTSTGFPVSNRAAVDNKRTDVNVVEKCGADDCQIVAERPLSHRVTDAGPMTVRNIDIIAPPRGFQQFVNVPGCFPQLAVSCENLFACTVVPVRQWRVSVVQAATRGCHRLEAELTITSGGGDIGQLS